MPIAEITDRAAEEIRLLIGIDVTDYKHMLSGNALEHIEIRHGKNGEEDHSLSDPNDIARMGYVLENYDVIEPVLDSQGRQKRSTQYSNADNTMAPLISFKKSVNGTYYVVEAVPVSAAKQLRVVSAYMQKKGGSTDQVLNMAKAPQLTPKVPHGADTPAGTPPVNAEALRVTSKNATVMPDNSIQQSGGNYHNNYQASLKTGNTAAKPAPAEASVEQEYRNRIAYALQYGDYQRAAELYREYNNPALRAYKEFYTQKIFSEYAATQGYGPTNESAIGADGDPSPFGESERQTLKQEWEEVGPPKEYDGVFDDFAELNLSREENNALRELQSLSASSGYEYCIIIADGKASEPMTSESKNSVGFLLDQNSGRVTLLHSHTNATPPSVSDLRMLLNEKVEKIGSIGYNGDYYIAYNDYGITPSAEEFDIITKKISDEVNVDLLNDPDFYSWSLSERNYMAIREQAYRIVRYFEWTMEGGRIDE